MIMGGKAHPDKLINSITVTYLQFPDCIDLAQLDWSEPVIILAVDITPIWKPVLSKL